PVVARQQRWHGPDVIEVAVRDDDRFRIDRADRIARRRPAFHAIIEQQLVVDQHRTSADLARAAEEFDVHWPSFMAAGFRPVGPTSSILRFSFATSDRRPSRAARRWSSRYPRTRGF